MAVSAYNLRSGWSKSCGCLKASRGGTNANHGMHKTSTYNVWNGMKARCLNPKNPKYHRYGGRGIKVCDRWLAFENFFADMGEKPQGKSLDRHPNNDGDYEPGNCRWATIAEQNNNTSVNHLLEYNGEVKTVSEWAIKVGLHQDCLFSRILNLGWSVERALTTPSKGKT